MKTLVILNPHAGSADELDEARHLLDGLPDVEIHETDHAGHAAELARMGVDRGAELVVSAGGDGTLNEVVNGLSEDFGRCRLGVLPVGTGNDFARSIGVPAGDVEAAVAILHSGERRRIDVARVRVGNDTRWFLNMSVGGFSTAVNEALDEETKQRWGSLAYARSAVEALPGLTPYRTRCRLYQSPDDEEGRVVEASLYVLVIANARYVASGVPAAPDARIDDGLLDLVAFPEMPATQIAGLAPPTLLGRHPDHELITVERAQRIVIESTPPMPFNVDGETGAETPLEFAVEPGALDVVVGAAFEPDDA